MEDDRIDEPGEIAIRGTVIEVFAAGEATAEVGDWAAATAAEGPVTIAASLTQGFVDLAGGTAVVAAADVLGSCASLGEAAPGISGWQEALGAIAAGDLVVHEEKGLGRLHGLEPPPGDADREAKQSGHVKLIGLPLYQHLLAGALRAARGEAPLADHVALAFDAGGALPGDYIPEASLRLGLYRRLARAADPREAARLAGEIEDRFGPPPPEAAALLAAAEIRALARTLGIGQDSAGPQGVALDLGPEADAERLREALPEDVELRGTRLLRTLAGGEGEDAARRARSILSGSLAKAPARETQCRTHGALLRVPEQSQEDEPLPRISCLPVLTLVLIAALAPPLAAQERPVARITLGLGAGAAPEYFGSGDMGYGPAGIVGFQELVLPGGLGFGTDAALPTDPGIGIRGGFRYISERDAADFPELAGLSRVDQAFELGLGLFRITERTRTYAEVRKGFGGHDGWVGEAGIDLLLRPTDRLVLAAGPRAYVGDDTFMQTYFGVTPEEAAASSLAAFRPDGGVVSLGAELNARHYFAEDWSLLGTLGWRRLQGDAADSPITKAGSSDQYRARLLVTRTFTLGR